MKKRLKRKVLKNTMFHDLFFYVEFNDGRVLEVPMRIKNENYERRDRLVAQLRDRKGVLKDDYGHQYPLEDMIHYEIFEDKHKK